MTLRERWTELETAAPGEPGHLRSRVPIDCTADVYIAVAEPSGCRLLALAFPSDVDIAPLVSLRLRGLEVAKTPFAVGVGGPTISIATRSREHNEIFARLADDLVTSLNGQHDAPNIVSTTAGRLAHWQRFLERSSPDGLSQDAQAGLFGELWFLHEHVMATIGVLDGVQAWRGPLRALQDFQLGSWAAEVKTTRQTAPAAVRIANERQLQTSGLRLLGLVVVALEQQSGGSASLPTAVEALRSDLAEFAEARSQFEDLLLSAGYVDDQSHLYAQVSYAIRWAFCAIVREGFPRLTESDLPPGVGDASYGIAIDAVKPFVVDFTDFTARVRGESA